MIDCLPLIRAQDALKAAESAERNGLHGSAAQLTQKAIAHAFDWLAKIDREAAGDMADVMGREYRLDAMSKNA